MIRYLCPNQSSVAVSGPARAPARLIFTREKHVISVDDGFDWLEGATGVRLTVQSRPGLVTVSVAGEIDLASADVIAGVARDAMARSCAGVALDLSGATFIDDAAAAVLAHLRVTGALPAVPRKRARG